jgi:hypothetical protein
MKKVALFVCDIAGTITSYGNNIKIENSYKNY